ncbi:MAG: L,D-transpeptidase family protein [Candidatus Riflebacteria bacterium]|nr:L,D-transpeptidase family protein [Candidatus Riflebacteria bacterium]
MKSQKDVLNVTIKDSILSELNKTHARQAMVVLSAASETSQAYVYFLEKRQNKVWRSALSPVQACVGRNGVALPGRKREGDGKTPAGIFQIGSAFGYAASIETKMPYLAVTSEDIWVDDVNSPDYNRFRKKGTTSAGSYEEMRRKDSLYRYGLVVEYNTSPVIKGAGSAIFIHVWSGPGTSTSGCIAFPEEKMREILAWLDPAKKPVITIERQ